jgi:hypothetical protein
VLDSRVLPDHDDTVVRAPRTVAPGGEPDLDDTVRRGASAVPVPPELVEPPVARAAPVVPGSASPLSTPLVATPEPEPVVPAYRVLLLDGTEIPLDRPVYLGRKPTPPRIPTGVPPRLVPLPSPGRELSATHLELSVVGGALVASDLRSTNGTIVRLPGAAPRTLIRGESTVVVPGTRLDLGDGAVVDILSGAVAS